MSAGKTGKSTVSRRAVLGRLGTSSIVVWSAPILSSVTIPSAYAQQSVPGPCAVLEFCPQLGRKCSVQGCPPFSDRCRCARMLDGSCFCYEFFFCSPTAVVCRSDSDCGPGLKCGQRRNCEDCQGGVACFSPCPDPGRNSTTAPVPHDALIVRAD
jgi:hypothetical protein